jgi:hypothetical protein
MFYSSMEEKCDVKSLKLTAIQRKKNYLFAPICAFQMHAVEYKVYHHPPFLLIGLDSIGC